MASGRSRGRGTGIASRSSATILQDIQQCPLGYRVSDNLPYGKGWTAEKIRPVKGLEGMGRRTTRHRVAASIETPFANASGHEGNADSPGRSDAMSRGPCAGICQEDTTEAPSPAPAKSPIVLDNEYPASRWIPLNGAIVRISDKPGQIELAPPGGLADNFRLRASRLRPEEHTHPRPQAAAFPSCQGRQRVPNWNGPGRSTDGEGGTHNLAATMTYRLAGPELEFRFFLENRTDDKVAEVWYPLVGGLAGFSRGSGRGETCLDAGPPPESTIRETGDPAGRHPPAVTPAGAIGEIVRPDEHVPSAACTIAGPTGHVLRLAGRGAPFKHYHSSRNRRRPARTYLPASAPAVHAARQVV